MPEKVDGIIYPIEVSGSVAPLKEFNAEANRLIDTLKKLKGEMSSPTRSRGRGGAGGGGSAKSEKDELTDIEKELNRIKKARELLSDSEVRDARKLLALDREIFNIESQIARTRNAAVRNMRFAVSRERELLNAEIERSKLSDQKIQQSREDLAIRKANEQLERRTAKATDQILQGEQRRAEVVERKARIARELIKLDDRSLRSYEDLFATQSKINRLKREARLLDNKAIKTLERNNSELKKTAALQDGIISEKSRRNRIESEAELRTLKSINDAARDRLVFEKKIAAARQLVESGRGITGEAAAEQLGIPISQIKRANLDLDTLKERTQKVQTFTERLGNTFNNLKGTLERVSGASAGLFFTFRRLVGVLAIFTLARRVAQGISQLVRETINFNAELEQVELGVASVLVSTGELFDALGNKINNGAQAISEALPVARKQLELLRVDALKTSATFSDLSQAFQVAIAPGLQAGLDLDSIRRFTVQISQAATAIGLQQNQLAEEIRSILGGTIQIRTTRIAAALGITNENIRKAKELGVLGEFLEERFGSFAAAGQKSLQNFNTIITNLKDGLFLLLGTGSIEFFEGLKDILNETTDSIRTINELTGEVELNQNILAAVRELSSGMLEVVKRATSFKDSLDARSFVPVINAITDALTVLAAGVSGAIKGLIASFSDSAALVKGLSDALAAITGADLESTADSVEKIATLLGRAVGFIVAVKTAAFALTLTMAGLAKVTAAITLAWKAWRTIVFSTTIAVQSAVAAGTAMRAVLAGVNVIMTAVRAKAVATSIALNFWPALILAVIAGLAALYIWLKDIEQFVNIKVSTAFKVLGQNIKKAFVSAWAVIKEVFVGGLDFLLQKNLDFVESILGLLAKVSDTAEAVRDSFKEARKGIKLLDGTEEERAEALKKKLAEIDQEITNIRENSQKELIANDQQEKFSDRLKRGLTNGFSSLKGYIEDITGAGGTIELLSDQVNDMPPSISSASNAAKELSESFREAEEATRKVADELRVVEAQINATANGREQARLEAQAEVELQERIRDIRKEETEARRVLLGIQAKQERNESNIRALSEEQQTSVASLTKSIQAQLEAKSVLAQAENEAALAKLEQQKVFQEGDESQIAAAQLRYEISLLSLKAAQEQVNLAEFTSDQEQRFAQLSEEGAKRLVELAKEQIGLKGEFAAKEQEIAGLAQIRTEAERQSTEILARRLQLVAAEARLQAKTIREESSTLQGRAQRIQGDPTLSELQKRRLLLGVYEDTAQQASNILSQSRAMSEQVGMRLASIEEEQKLLEASGAQRSTTLDDEKQRLELAQARLDIAGSQAELELAQADKAREAIELGGDPTAFMDQYLINLANIQNQIGTTAQNLANLIASPFEGMHQGLLEGIRKYAQETGDIMDVVRGLATGVFQTLTASLAKFVADWVAQRIFMLVFGKSIEKATTAATLATASGTSAALTAIWAPAALSASIATLGGAVATGTAAYGAAIGTASVGAAAGGTAGAGVALGAANGGSMDQLDVGFARGGDGSAFNVENRRRKKAGRRPNSLDKRDRIPAWFRPGEVVFRPEAARVWGTSFLSGMNDLTIRPADILGLGAVTTIAADRAQAKSAATQASESISSGNGIGFARGGTGAAVVAPVSLPTAQESVDLTQSSRDVLAIIVPSMADAERVRDQYGPDTRIVKAVDKRIQRSRAVS